MPGFSGTASNGLTCSPITTNCLVANCIKCAPSAYCITCASGFTLNNSSCTAISACSGG
jgi:hypothetical protein